MPLNAAMHRFLNLNTYSFTRKSLAALTQFSPVPCIRCVHNSKRTSYTREKKLNPNFRARWLAPAAQEFNRRRQKVAIDQILRDGKEKVCTNVLLAKEKMPIKI